MPGRGDEARATEAQDRVRDRFRKLAYQTATAVGSPWGFQLAWEWIKAAALGSPRSKY